MLAAEAQLTEWDTVAGDGDCGITAARGGTALQQLADSGCLPLRSPPLLLLAVAAAVSESMGGTSGALYELGLRAAANCLQQGEDWVAAFSAAVRAVQFYGGARAGYRTMLDALLPAEAALVAGGGLSEAAAAAEGGAAATCGMQALAGRANYVPDAALQGVPDPGAKAVAFMLRALAQLHQDTGKGV